MSLSVDNLTFGYSENRRILKNISFEAESGELTSVLGRNGAGKSTLFKCILGIIRNYEGEIFIHGRSMIGISARELSGLIAYIPQSHYPAFNYSVLDMVLMGSANQLKSTGSPGKRQETEALKALEKMNILHLADRGFGQISGGEQQLVLMARAILQNTGVWLLDEPLASLDYGNQTRVLQRLKKLSEDGYLIVQSIHNPDQAKKYSDRIIALADGAVIDEGKPDEILNEKLIKRLYGDDVEWHQC